MPDRDSFEDKQRCNRLYSEDKIDSEEVKEWVSRPIIERYERIVASLPEAGAKDLEEKASPYIDDIRSGRVTEVAVNNVAYLVAQATAK